MGRQAMNNHATDSLFGSAEPTWLTGLEPQRLEPERPKFFSRVFGLLYQLLLWTILILGAVHTVHQRVHAPVDGEPGAAHAAASRGLDYLSSLLWR